MGSKPAARFLTQATFGPKLEEIRALGDRASFDAWFTAQRSAPISLELPYLRARDAAGDDVYQDTRVEAWWRNAVNGPDQLRQRMAFALSEIMVVSDAATALEGEAEMLAAYYDILSRNALGNYRTLLEEVTLSQAMGYYLSMFQNQKPDPDNGIRADENYAREIMQLFTVGLDQLNLDGSIRRDGAGQAIPTYSQSDIQNLARVFTGWSYPGGTDEYDFYYVPNAAPELPMQAYALFHDDGAKTIINNTAIPAGGTAVQDLDLALDALFNHPNVGPFIGRQLIQRLVTSNPSPGYVLRVAQAFNNNGSGVRGDLYAVVRAVLLDTEARNGHVTAPDTFGKLREPLLRVTQLWRAFNASSRNGKFNYSYPEQSLGQAPLRSPSVFNFFRPRYQPVGALADAGLVAPEFQITNETTITATGNDLYYLSSSFTDSRGGTTQYLGEGDTYLDFRPWETRAANPQALLDDLDLLLLSGGMSAAMRQTLTDYVEQVPLNEPGSRVHDVVNLIVGSSQYAIQR